MLQIPVDVPEVSHSSGVDEDDPMRDSPPSREIDEFLQQQQDHHNRTRLIRDTSGVLFAVLAIIFLILYITCKQ
jgi:hypothetical protein